ncbi:MAG TPA: AAA family ATPase [Steroidobacter sp.]
MSAVEASLAKIDGARLRRLGQMLVTESDEYHEPRQVLYDLAGKNAADILAEFRKTREGYATSPFDPDGRKFRFYRKGYTIWSGYPGAGKTTALRQLVCHLLHSRRKVFVASFEEHPVDVIVQLAGVCFGTEEPTEHQLQWFIDFYSERLKIWGVTGIVSHRELFGTIQRLAKEGVTQVLIDSLMCLDINSQDFEAHRLFANRLNAMCIESDIHTHLVAHPRKAISVEQEPDLNDVAGGADYARLAHNVAFVRKKGTDQMGDLTGMQICIRKQRYGSGFTGDITGWFNRRLRQFKLDQFDQVPTQYMPKQAYEDEL